MLRAVRGGCQRAVDGAVGKGPGLLRSGHNPVLKGAQAWAERRIRGTSVMVRPYTFLPEALRATRTLPALGWPVSGK
jgi:hypothetical protein